MEILTFELSEQICALPLGDVREVVRVVAVTPLPGAPAAVEGVINVRGLLVPVLDIRGRFGLPARPTRLSDRLILADGGARTVAIRVDATGWIQSVAEPESLPVAEDWLPGHRPKGVAKLEDGLALIHDLRAFLSQPEAEALDGALRAAEEP